MWDKFKQLLSAWNDPGLRLPNAVDPETKSASSTLLFFYLSGTVAIIWNIILFFKPDVYTASAYTLVLFILSFVFYRLRKLDKFKVDLDDKTIELDAQDEPTEKK